MADDPGAAICGGRVGKDHECADCDWIARRRRVRRWLAM